jgi:polysaccharide deacetylase family protein (PEP-CTERM system associated)
MMAARMPLTVTFDLEDNRCSPEQEARFEGMSEQFFEFAERRRIRATVFVVGEIARSHPQLIRRAASAGHEIALHGMGHVALDQVGPQRLESELHEGRALLEDVAQQPVQGFRAPIFSLTPSTAWAVEQICEAGFTYSSSVLPAANPLHGWPGAPGRPFRWGNGLLELPCPVGGWRRVQIPFLGGIYLRYVPAPLARRFLHALADGAVPWSYSHPYDLDPDEPFFVMPNAGWVTSRILHTRRGSTLACLERMLAVAGGPGKPLAEIAASLAAGDPLPIFAG